MILHTFQWTSCPKLVSATLSSISLLPQKLSDALSALRVSLIGKSQVKKSAQSHGAVLIRAWRHISRGTRTVPSCILQFLMIGSQFLSSKACGFPFLLRRSQSRHQKCASSPKLNEVPFV